MPLELRGLTQTGDEPIDLCPGHHHDAGIVHRDRCGLCSYRPDGGARRRVQDWAKLRVFGPIKSFFNMAQMMLHQVGRNLGTAVADRLDDFMASSIRAALVADRGRVGRKGPAN